MQIKLVNQSKLGFMLSAYLRTIDCIIYHILLSKKLYFVTVYWQSRKRGNFLCTKFNNTGFLKQNLYNNF